MKATMIFYNDSADVSLKMDNGRDGNEYVTFGSVSEMTRYAGEHGIEIDEVVTL